MRYTKWDPGEGRFCLPLPAPLDGRACYTIKTEPGEAVHGIKVTPDVATLYGEFVDEMARLEMEAEQRDKELEYLQSRLRHLLRSKAVHLFDELDPNTGAYKRDIRRLDSCVDFNLAMETEAQLKAKSEALAEFQDDTMRKIDPALVVFTDRRDEE